MSHTCLKYPLNSTVSLRGFKLNNWPTVTIKLVKQNQEPLRSALFSVLSIILLTLKPNSRQSCLITSYQLPNLAHSLCNVHFTELQVTIRRRRSLLRNFHCLSVKSAVTKHSQCCLMVRDKASNSALMIPTWILEATDLNPDMQPNLLRNFILFVGHDITVWLLYLGLLHYSYHSWVNTLTIYIRPQRQGL